MKKCLLAFSLLSLTCTLVYAQMPARTPAPAGAEVYIVSPADGAKIKGPVVVRFGLKGLGIAPAGIQFENTGHHHLFIDTPLPTDMGAVIGTVDNKIVHFGKGQTETTLNLAPGKHTLQLLVGDYLHIPHVTPLTSKPVTITVTK